MKSIKEIREEAREPSWQRLKEKVGGEAGEALVRAFKALYDLHNDHVIDWFAALYDKETGAYYYSNSARDNDGFLPDVESTLQALGFFSNSGMAESFVSAIPDWMKRDIGNFVYGLQDPDGYFYHKQWGKNIAISRRARDFNWSMSILNSFGIKPKYPTILDKGTENEGADTLTPDHLTTKEKFLEYLESKNIAERSYHAGNELSSQARQIIACGLMDDLIAFLNAHQIPETGHWHAEPNYYGVNGLLKISGIYSAAKVPMPHPEAAADSALEALFDPEPLKAVVDLYNPWFAIGNILENQRAYGGEEGCVIADKIVKRIRENAPRAIEKSLEKIRVFQKPDGSFSYGVKYSSATSQGAPAAVFHTEEGDVNGTVIAMNGVINHIYRALELREYKVPLFCKADLERYISLLEEK